MVRRSKRAFAGVYLSNFKYLSFMRTVNVKRFFGAAAALFTVAVFASCSNEDEPLPEVVKSEILDSGLDDQVVSKPVEGVSGTNGVELSYQSWIRVKGETRAFFDDKVTVTLTDIFSCVDSTVNVGSFELSGYHTSVSYKKRGERQEDFVQVSDSIMAYTVSFDQFSFDYELLFETAVYDDGYTRQEMPYHRIGAVKDNGYVLSDMEFEIETDEHDQRLVYLRKRFSHSISVDFNGRDYLLTADIVLRKYVGNHPCPVESRLVESGISEVDDEVWSTSYTVWAEVAHVCSDGTEKSRRYSAELTGSLEYETQSYKIFPDNGLKLESSGFVGDAVRDTVYIDGPVVVRNFRRTYETMYNYFSFSCPVNQYEASYDDGIIKFDFPKLEYGILHTVYELRFVGEEENAEGRRFNEYFLKQEIVGEFGQAQHQVSDEFQVIVYLE